MTDTVYAHRFWRRAEHRFWQRFDGNDPYWTPPEDCWEWPGARNRDGYGLITVDGVAYRTHRLAYALFIGYLPADKKVLHRCDNPPCSRPSHLRVGSQAQNIADMHAKGRAYTARGEAVAAGVLTTEKVLAIRERHAAGESLDRLAVAFAVTKHAVQTIVTGEGWAHVGGPTRATYDYRGAQVNTAKLTDDQVRTIRARWAANPYRGFLSDVSREYGLTPAAVQRIVRRDTWQHVE